MKLGIAGFQSLKKAVFEFEPGEVVLIKGLNNVGKSAVTRAFEAFITNHAYSKDYINQEVGSVRVVYKDDKLYEWRRTESTSSYFINGEEKRKLNRIPLIEVDPSCGFLVEKGEGELFVPQILREGEVMFPFNTTPSNVFRLFSRFMASPKIGALLKDIKVMIREDKEKLGRVRGSVDAYETELSKVKGLLEKAPPKEELEELKKRVEKLVFAKTRYGRQLPAFQLGLERKKDLINEKSRCEERIRRLSPLVERINTLEVDREKISSYENKLGVLLTQKARLGEIGGRAYLLTEFRDRYLNKVDRMGVFITLEERFVEASVKRTELLKGRLVLESRVEGLKKELAGYDSCPLCNRPF